MYKALIVDDEMIFREYLKTILEWENYGIELAGEAKNGEKALELVKKQDYDIVFADISMPVMDGITFCTEALRIKPDLAVVLISGHNEFEYAKSALQMGIRDYILKPFDKEELIKTVVRITDSLDQRRKKQVLEKTRDRAAFEIYANALISDSFLTMRKEIEELLTNLAKGKRIWGYRVVAIEEDFFDRQWFGSGQKFLWKSAVINILEELLEEKYHPLIFCGRSGDVVVILAFEEKEGAQGYSGKEFERLCRLVQNKLGFSVTCAFSDTVQDWRDIPAAYDSAASLLEKKLQLGFGKILTTEHLKNLSGRRQYLKIPTERLIVSLRNGNEEELQNIISELFLVLHQKKADMEMTRMVYMELISLCLSCLAERGMEIAKILGGEFSPFRQAKQLFSIEAAKAEILEIYGKVVSVCSDGSFTRSNKIAAQAKEFIQNNYMDKNLSVEGVARNLYINAGYLRAVFKKEYGITVIGYIFKIRMEKAREIILSGKFKLIAVSQMVGFSDAAYFSKCFKKYYGISPSSFENMQQGPGALEQPQIYK